MLPAVIYAVRAAVAGVVALFGFVILLAAIATEPRTPWTIGVPIAIAAAGVLAWPRRPSAWRRDQPTDRQLAYAKDLGIAVPEGISKGQLSDLISEATGRR